MALIMSFAWTSGAVQDRIKTETRRFWNDRYAKMFKKGMLVQAYDRSPRFRGKRIGWIRILKEPYKQKLKKRDPEVLRRSRPAIEALKKAMEEGKGGIIEV